MGFPLGFRFLVINKTAATPYYLSPTEKRYLTEIKLFVMCLKYSLIQLYDLRRLRRTAVLSIMVCALATAYTIISLMWKLHVLIWVFTCLVYLKILGSTHTAYYVCYDRWKEKGPSWVNTITTSPQQSPLLWFFTPSCLRWVSTKIKCTSLSKRSRWGSEWTRFGLLCNHACDCTVILSPR